MRQILRSKYLKLTAFALITFAILTSLQIANSFADELNLKLPDGFKVTIYADSNTKNGRHLESARFMIFDREGNLYLSTAKEDKVVKVVDHNKDGKADEVTVIASGLNAPQGMVLLNDGAPDATMLVANQDGVVKLTKKEGQWTGKATPFISNLAQGWHTLKNIKLGPDGYLYVNIGSSCNVCIEADATRATIMRYTKEGKPAGALVTLGRHQPSAIWANGLRNSQGYAWHPVTGEMFATNNGSDMRSETKGGKVNDELPPEHLNKIEAGKHYGWPYCWGGDASLKGQIQDPNFVGEADFCKTAQAPAITFTSHSTPIGITFLDKTNFPAEYQNDAIVALHGSWNRKQLAGYKLVRVKFNAQHQPSEVVDFATGWLANNKAWGRPVDVAVGTDKALYVSDDKLGVIYRVTYQGTSQ